MIYFYYGTEGLLLKEKIAEVAAGDRFDLAEEGHKAAFEGAIKSVGLFSVQSTMAVRNAFLCGDWMVALLKDYGVADDKERTVIVVEEGGGKDIAKKAKKLWDFLEKHAKVHQIKPLQGKALNDWVVAKASEAGCKIEPAAIAKLVTYTNVPADQWGKVMRADLWRLKSEIEKLCSYASGAQATMVTVAMVELLVMPPVSLNVFDLTDALAARDRASAVTALARHLQEGNDPFHVHSMFVYQFRNLLRVKALSNPRATSVNIATKTKLHPYVVSKLFAAARKFELDELKRNFLQLIQLERDAKNGIFDMTDGLYQFIFALHD